MLFLLLLPLGVLLLLLLLPLSVLLLFLLLLLGVLLLLLLLLLPLSVLLLLLLLLLLGVLLLLLLLLLLGVLLLLLLLLPLGILLLLLLLLLLDVLLLLLLLLPLDVLLLLLLSRRSILPLGYRGLRNILLRRALWCSAHRRLNTLDSAHIHDANRCARSRRTLAYLLDLGWRKRATGILSQRRLLPVEGNRSRRRSGARHHGPAQHVGRRTCGPGCGVCPGAENALPLRRDRRSAEDLGRSKLSSRYRSRILSHPAASGEGVLRNRRDAVLNIPVHVLDVGNRRVIGIPAVVVIVVYGGVIDHRVGVVHPRKITLAHLVRREIRLTRTQGEPSYCRSSADGKAQAETRAPSPSANPRHQRRRINGSHAIRSRVSSPNGRQRKPSGHSDRERIPTVRRPPRSNPRARSRPNARHDRAPSLRRLRSASTPGRSRADYPSGRTDPSPHSRPFRGKRNARTAIGLPGGPARSTTGPMHRLQERRRGCR